MRSKGNTKLALVFFAILGFGFVLAIVLEGYFFSHSLPNVKGSSSNSTKILYPLYVYPDVNSANSVWKKVANTGGSSVVAIINPNSGPGGPPDANYRAGMDILKASKVMMLGYVPTNYSKRSQTEVKSDVDVYFNHYKDWFSGIFFDEVSTDLSKKDYYSLLFEYVRGKQPPQQSLWLGGVALNFGTAVSSSWLSVGDILVIFEGPYSQWKNHTLPTWTKEEPAFFSAALIYDAPSSSLTSVLDKLTQNNIGFSYISDDSGADNNPYNTLPSYWNSLVGAGTSPVNPTVTPPTGRGSTRTPMPSYVPGAISSPTTPVTVPDSFNRPPACLYFEASTEKVAVKDEVTFNFSAYDSDNDPLTYRINYGDRLFYWEQVYPNTASHTYSNSSPAVDFYKARLLVSDGHATTNCDPVVLKLLESDNSKPARNAFFDFWEKLVAFVFKRRGWK